MRLVKGAGSIETGACWMSAISYYAGYAWSDHPECVDPVIRELCIKLNDILPSDAERERVIGPHMMTPIGTAQGVELMQARAFVAADMAVRVWSPKVLEAAGRVSDAKKLRSLPEIVDTGTAADAADAAYAIAVDIDAYYAATAANYASTNHASADSATKSAICAANTAGYADAAPDLLALILRLCAMGERVEVPQVRQLCELPQ